MGHYDSTDDTLRDAVGHEDHDTVPYVYADDSVEDKPAGPVPAGDVPAVDPHVPSDRPYEKTDEAVEAPHGLDDRPYEPHEQHASEYSRVVEEAPAPVASFSVTGVPSATAPQGVRCSSSQLSCVTLSAWILPSSAMIWRFAAS